MNSLADLVAAINVAEKGWCIRYAQGHRHYGMGKVSVVRKNWSREVREKLIGKTPAGVEFAVSPRDVVSIEAVDLTKETGAVARFVSMMNQGGGKFRVRLKVEAMPATNFASYRPMGAIVLEDGRDVVLLETPLGFTTSIDEAHIESVEPIIEVAA